MPEQPFVPRVGFIATLLSLSGGYRAAGIHRYITGLLSALADTRAVAVTAFTAEPHARAALPAAIDLCHVPAAARRPAVRILWEQLGLPWALRRTGAHLVHGPAYAVPVTTPVPAVVTVHDLSFMRLPGTFPRAQGAYLRAATRWSVRHARAVITVSEFTRREVLSLVGADPARVRAIPNGLDPACQRPPAAAIEAYRHRVGLPERFILTVGTVQPRKNLGTLIAACAELHRRQAETVHLAVAGAPGWGNQDLGDQAAALGVADRVHLLGYVPPADLAALYSAATVFALPSRYEGFGLPVLEAMACGTPTVVADGSSLGEVGGDAVMVVPPDDVAAWATALAAVLSQPDRAAALAQAGLARSRAFSWERTGRETLAVYQQALASGATRPAHRTGAHDPA